MNRAAGMILACGLAAWGAETVVKGRFVHRAHVFSPSESRAAGLAMIAGGLYVGVYWFRKKR